MKLCYIIIISSIIVLIGSAWKERQAKAGQRPGSFRTVGVDTNLVRNAHTLLGQVKKISLKIPRKTPGNHSPSEP